MKISKFTLTILLIGIAFLIFRFGIQPPIPSSLLFLYMVIAIFSVAVFISVSNKSLNEFYAPIKAVIVDEKKWLLRFSIFIALPVLVSSITYLKIAGEVGAPVELRSVHPAPPSLITFRGKALNLIGLENPLRNDKENFDNYVEEGAKIYFQNCFFCHGDNLDGKGHFASALNPVPANFVDKGTVAQLQESYVFWRISKGGPGLPNEGTPWNTAMPVWEDILTEDEIWKVVMYIYEASGVEPRTWEESHSDYNEQESVKHNDDTINKGNKVVDAGKDIYMKKCQYCHGADGKGGGPAAEFLSPRPRDLTKARYKLKSTPGGELPTDNDIFNIISNGIRGTSMPAWTTLTDDERWQVVKYVKTLARRFKRAKEKGKPQPVPIEIGNAIPSTDESIEKGKALFSKLECQRCHGENGRGNGSNALTLKDDWGHPIRPANLWKYWRFKGGDSATDIYKTITTGRAGTPMPSFIDSASDEDRWHLANYVKSIGYGSKPEKAAILKSSFVKGSLPETVEDDVWDLYDANEFSLFGQILVEPKLYTPAIDVVYVKSVFNDEGIVFLVEWDDISESESGVTETGNEIFPDEMVLQFPNQIPETTVSERPYFLRGSKMLGVNLWSWNKLNGVKEFNANGIGAQNEQKPESSDIKGQMVYDDGRYKLLFSRALTTGDKIYDLQFETNKFIPVAFSIRDGHNGESGTKMAISIWNNLFLEKKETDRKFIISLIAGLFIVLAEFVVLWRVK